VPIAKRGQKQTPFLKPFYPLITRITRITRIFADLSRVIAIEDDAERRHDKFPSCGGVAGEA
jgi:hypothetical protein